MRIKSGGKSDAEGWACTYRFFNAAGDLLYVGACDDHDVRWRGHMKRLWWRDVARKEVIWFECRLDALYEESRAIATENPIHNDRPGLSPVGLKLFRFNYRGRPVVREGRLAITRWDKDQAIREVLDRGAHGWVTYEGKPTAVAVPLDWYLEACRRMGTPVDLASHPQVEWEKV